METDAIERGTYANVVDEPLRERKLMKSEPLLITRIKINPVIMHSSPYGLWGAALILSARARTEKILEERLK